MNTQTFIFTRRARAIADAREWLSHEPLFLDTETTGLGDHDQVCEIALLDVHGGVVLETLIKPTCFISRQAVHVHGIDHDDVKDAPEFPAVWPQIARLLAQRHVMIYNADFDTRLLTQSALANNVRWPPYPALRAIYHDAMLLYAKFYGEWNAARRSFRWHPLENAARHCGLLKPQMGDDPDKWSESDANGGQPHRARGDAELCRRLVHYIAQQEDEA